VYFIREVVLNEGLQTIGRAAFSNCSSLERITLPSTLTEISVETFYECTRLREVILHEGIQKIGRGSFVGCTALEYITIPSTVTVISSDTFYGCERLREVELHEGIQMIALDAFDGCSSLETFKFPNLSTRLDTITRAGQTEVEDKIDDIRGDSVERRGSELFIPVSLVLALNWGTIHEVLGQIDRSITYYELREAISNSNTIYNRIMNTSCAQHMQIRTSLQIMTSETSEVVFECTGFELDIPEDVTIVRFHSSVTEFRDRMFAKCKQLRKVTLNEGLRKIGYGSFNSCNKLEYINFPSTITEIGDYAFQHCSSLKKVVLNEGFQTIGNSVFNLCSSLESVVFPSTTIKIGDYAFNNCRNLRQVVLSEGINKIGRFAFDEYGWSALEIFKFPTISARLDTIIQAGKYVDVENKIDIIRGDLVDRRDGELFVYASSPGGEIISVGDNWKVVKEPFDQIDRLITYYELKEATTFLELAMWKSKIDQAEVKHLINRIVYRIDIPGPVMNTILQYLDFRV